MFLLDAENVVDRKTKQSVHGEKKNHNSIESYFSRKVFNRDKNVFAIMCLQQMSQFINLGLKKYIYINTVMNIKYELCTTVYLTLL